ncbi:MAG: hypothetical protein LBK18_02770 [Prevotellaceae bacterium]|jgi:uncharacterized protein (TIGR02145 family)|nr:hypothetical protein [Prevotellaceae bacterium]
MRKFLSPLLVGLLTLAVANSCEKDKDVNNDDNNNAGKGDAPVLSVTPTTIAALSTAGSYAVAVTANVAWTAAVDAAAAAWCTVASTSGNGNDTVAVNVAATADLAPRTATITFTADTMSRSVTLTQAAFVPTLSVDKTDIAADNAAGSYAVAVTANVAWTAAVDDDAATWCTLSPTSASGNDTVAVSVAASTDLAPRTATITFTADTMIRSVTLTQAAFVPTLSVDKTAIAAANAAGSYAVTVTANVAWTAAVDDAAAIWCTIAFPTSPFSNTVMVEVAASTDLAPRTATITFTAGELSRSVTLTQEAFVPALSVDKTAIAAAGIAGSYAVVVTANVAWTATVDDAAATAWCTVAPPSGNDNDTVTVEVTANDTEEPRVATITFTAADVPSRSVTLTQEAEVIAAPTHAASPTQWTITSADGTVRQTWSDHINIPACNKTSFSGGTAAAPQADCRNNPDGGYFLYSGVYVQENAATLCPNGWRVPTKDDFDKVIDMHGYKPTGFLSSTADGNWGGRLGGYSNSIGTIGSLPGTAYPGGYYWSAEEDDDSGISAYFLGFNGSSHANIEAQYKAMGYGVRCVR